VDSDLVASATTQRHAGVLVPVSSVHAHGWSAASR
jgi:hypothetical protein